MVQACGSLHNFNLFGPRQLHVGILNSLLPLVLVAAGFNQANDDAEPQADRL